MKTTAIFALCIFISTLAVSQEREPVPSDFVIQLRTVVSENPASITFKWNKTPDTGSSYKINIYRKTKEEDEWGNPKEILVNETTEFTDDNVEPGIEYEYKVEGMYGIRVITYVMSGIQCKEVEYRGKLILLVDSTFVQELEKELLRLEADLIGDGWEVLRKDISRNASVKYVKSVIRDFYDSDPENVNTVFLFGHIPVPYSGDDAFDGHTEDHKGAWPADMYYGSMNESIWRDKWVNSTTAARQENKNVPGDGKFDRSELPAGENITLAIGRVDLSNLPDLYQTETELLKNYLDKNHSFRHKKINPRMQALLDDNWDILYYTEFLQKKSINASEIFSLSGWRNFTALLNFQNIKTGKFFTETTEDSYIWSYGCGGGEFDSCKYIGSTNSFVNHHPKTVFTAFYGSRFGDWDSENNFMRAALASKGWILTTCWAGRPHYTFHQMGMGETIGHCVRTTQNNSNFYFSGRTKKGIHQSLMGDPSLRMHIVEPPNSLKSKIRGDKFVNLSWNAPNEDIIGYYIYKLDTLTMQYKRITESPLTETSFKDVFPDEGNNYYMIRALKLSKVTSGSYYNLSQGIFDTIYFESVTPTSPEITQNETLIYPNPSTGLFNISFEPNVRLANIKIFNLQGKLMREFSFRNPAIERFELGILPKGIYMVSGNIDGKKMVTKIVLK